MSVHFAGHYYLNPSERNSAYLGFGLLGSAAFTNQKRGAFTLSSDFIFGKEFGLENDKRHFMEMHVVAPSMWLTSKRTGSTYFPFVYVKYGISF